MKRSGGGFLFLSLVALLFLPATAGAQSYPVVAPSSPDEGSREGAFGGAVAVADGHIFVAEPQNSLRPDLIYIYRQEGDRWVEVARLEAPEEAAGGGFGRSLSVDGAVMAVAMGEDAQVSVQMYRRAPDGSWRHEGALTPPAGEGIEGFGYALEVSGDRLLVGSWSEEEQAGAAYVYRRAGSGKWEQTTRLRPEDLKAGDRFGVTVALEGEWAAVSATRQDSAAGSVYLYRLDAAGGATPQGKIRPSGAGRNDRFGSDVAFADDGLVGSAYGHDAFSGAAYEFAYDAETGDWVEKARLLPFDGRRQARFGITMAYTGSDLLVGAPGAGNLAGVVYVLRRDATGEWVSAGKVAVEDVERGDFLAGSLDAEGGLAVAGLVGDDYGAGSAVVLVRDASGEWRAAQRLTSPPESLDAIVGGQVECSEGAAAVFECRQVDLLAFLPVAELGGGRGVELNDVWGWIDPETGREYALVGRVDGTSFVDITDPQNPRYVGQLPKTATSPGSTWRDIKVYRDHAFIVADGAGEHGMQVFDLTQLRGVGGTSPPVTFEETAHYDGIHSAHNIVINEGTGFAYTVGNSAGGETCGGGLHMIDIRDPNNPKFAGCFADPSTGRQRTGYTHDAQCVTYHGPDEAYRGREICLGANETALSIADVTDKQNPVAISRAEYPNVGYAHQGWLTEDHRYFFLDDELDEIQAQGNMPGTRTLIFDVSDLDDPVLVKEFFGATRATDHNLYIRGHYVYQSNYVAGLRVLDIRDVENPVEVAYFDTVPYGDNEPGFGGSWSNYPFFESGAIVVTSGNEGLFILKQRPELVP